MGHAFRRSTHTPLHCDVQSPSSRGNLCPLSCGQGLVHWLCWWGRIWSGRESLERNDIVMQRGQEDVFLPGQKWLLCTFFYLYGLHHVKCITQNEVCCHADLFCFYSRPCVFYKTSELSRSPGHTLTWTRNRYTQWQRERSGGKEEGGSVQRSRAERGSWEMPDGGTKTQREWWLTTEGWILGRRKTGRD